MCTQALQVKFYLTKTVLVHAVLLNQFTDNPPFSMTARQHQTIQVGLYFRKDNYTVALEYCHKRVAMQQMSINYSTYTHSNWYVLLHSMNT